MPDTDPQASSHMMKTTKRGRPFLKDTLDLFATLIVSLQLAPHKQFFRTFPNSFSTDEAAQNLASLKFSQSNRGPDPREPSRVVTTTTTTTFSMTRDMAKAMSQHFMDARLIENAADPSSNLFKDRGIYILTPKGLHVLERFISKNGINSDHLQNVFITQPICIKLLHLERRSADDEIIVSQEEAAEMAAQFVRFGLITLVSDKRKNNDSAIIFTVRGSAPGGNSPVSQHGEFRCTAKAIYKITDEGRRVAHWDGSRPLGAHDSPNASSASLNAERSSVDNVSESGEKKGSDAKIHRRISMAEKLNVNYQAAEKKNTKESNTERLNYILEEPSLRSLFREFLRSNFCEENLSFWLDVQDFKRKFNITSSAVAVNPPPRSGSRTTPGQAAMERHHESLISTAFVIYNTNELVKYLDDVVTSLDGKPFAGKVEPEQANAFNATQLQTMIRLYERIQVHVFRLMATDSVPKFIKTPKFLAMRNWVEDFDPTDDDVRLLSSGPSQPPGLGNNEESGGAYITISQQASEREHRQQQAHTAPMGSSP
ncbi:regulator of G protein signaling superfamily [Lentinula edodes]|uniref:Regulator of G protein signaling superfamily n=1 Tax=Lentinula edodes TaxID=5353 RepID=A0A1Q3EM17_LENED|nr:regulator of G protein signaling superfamily [Lentinula edodes]